MKRLILSTLAILPIAAGGCDTFDAQQEDRAQQNAWMVTSISDTAINRAIVSQHTLYSYHFEANAAALNELGHHDLDILAEHFRDFPGRLNIRQGDSDTALYDARVAKVVTALQMAGVRTDRVTVADELPGGSGMGSEQVLLVLTQRDDNVTIESSLSNIGGGQ